MKYACLDISNIESKHKAGNSIRVEAFGKQYNIRLSEQKTGFGSRKFLVCPSCDRRTTRLYSNGGLFFTCAKCAGVNIYSPIQNGTKGGYIEITYRMRRYAAAHGIEMEIPFDYRRFSNDPRIENEQFRKSLLVLQALENMRMQNILYKTTYSTRIFQAILAGTHWILKEKSLYEMQRWLWRL